MVLVRTKRAVSSIYMTDLHDRLERLGLVQYYDPLVAEGFDTWETILDITESDLTYLNFKLGHRRKLQRCIAETRGQPTDRALPTDVRKAGADGAYRSGDDSTGEPRETGRPPNAAFAQASFTSNSGTKRKYRRHPKPDANAPDRPPSAYVIFSNQVREELKGQDLSFTEIAKVVGERWQVLPGDIREACEQQANGAKERYYAAMAEYKKTPDHALYQDYLAEFKAKHGPSRAEGKRSKLETEISSSSMRTSGSLDSAEYQHANGNRLELLLGTGNPRKSGTSPPSSRGLHAQHFRRPSSSSSPAVYPDILHSPIKLDPYSPQESSPRSTATMTGQQYRASSRGSDVQSHDAHFSTSRHASTQQYVGYRAGEAWAATEPGQQSFLTSLPQRESRIPQGVPALTRQESTISSAGSSIQALPTPVASLPPIDVSKARRTLPTPVMTVGPNMSPLDRNSIPLPRSHISLTTQGPPVNSHSHSGSGSNWPALLRATELAREAEGDPYESPP